ncbi:hypothetical protein EsDP_00003050 [Epichloe bromicola]|uniref:Secreted protein n=1 Tax=Epichloe bromicola TaxID=79588 RepID=A0ABQ0CMM9_9HYPO
MLLTDRMAKFLACGLGFVLCAAEVRIGMVSMLLMCHVQGNSRRRDRTNRHGDDDDDRMRCVVLFHRQRLRRAEHHS